MRTLICGRGGGGGLKTKGRGVCNVHVTLEEDAGRYAGKTIRVVLILLVEIQKPKGQHVLTLRRGYSSRNKEGGTSFFRETVRPKLPEPRNPNLNRIEHRTC